MPFPVKKEKLPADLAAATPGQLEKVPGLLVAITPTGKLYHGAAKSWAQMREKALSDGLEHFKPTSAGDTYRSVAMQRAGFLARYTKDPIPGASTRTWNGAKWYLKPGNAPMAAPGTSQHNLGIAVDIHTASGERLEWMLANIEAFGWSWQVQSEPWHIAWVDPSKTA